MCILCKISKLPSKQFILVLILLETIVLINPEFETNSGTSKNKFCLSGGPGGVGGGGGWQQERKKGGGVKIKKI